jgi:hypothetical protein
MNQSTREALNDDTLRDAFCQLSEAAETGSLVDVRMQLVAEVSRLCGADQAVLYNAAHFQPLTLHGHDESSRAVVARFFLAGERYAHDLSRIASAVHRLEACVQDDVFARTEALRLPLYDEFFRALGSSDECALVLAWRGAPTSYLTGNRLCYRPRQLMA